MASNTLRNMIPWGSSQGRFSTAFLCLPATLPLQQNQSLITSQLQLDLQIKVVRLPASARSARGYLFNPVRIL